MTASPPTPPPSPPPAPPPSPTPPESPAPRDKRILRVLITSSMVSKVADWQLGIVIPLAVLAESDSVALSLVSFALRGVTYVGSPFLGSVIDRFDKRLIFVLAQLQQALCLVFLAATLSSQVSVAVLVLLSGVGGVASAITGQFVLIPKLISAPGRPVAVAKLNSAIELSKVIGLVLGGVGFTLLGPAAATLCIALLYVVAGCVALLLPAVAASPEKINIRRDLAIGFRWVGKREILWLVVTMSMTNLAIGQLEPALITEFGDQGMNTTVISAVMAIGLLTGAGASRVAPHFLPVWTPERRILVCQLIGFGGLALIAVPVLPVRVVGFMVECFAVAVSNVASITYRQETIPADVAGRANATIRMFITGAAPLSGFLYAWASRLDGYWYWLPALGLWATANVIWAVHVRRGASPLGRGVPETPQGPGALQRTEASQGPEALQRTETPQGASTAVEGVTSGDR
ncbi:MFS transporter [Streptomyces sp. p1417]|uniref:MFS transporter n=1 Tax=Streptomyces typhae TaxID=2681492 RepID=A0A6L6X645_9ACTN|nr:MFS transporter [Streptomyces typhae]MVO88949.1 MFS transporter [Streptomyces typhae]